MPRYCKVRDLYLIRETMIAVKGCKVRQSDWRGEVARLFLGLELDPSRQNGILGHEVI